MLRTDDRKYGLIILVPSTPVGYRELCRIESPEPFPTIQKGDLIDARTLEGEAFELFTELFEYDELLKAEEIHHNIFQRKDGSYNNHDITIFTKVVKK